MADSSKKDSSHFNLRFSVNRGTSSEQETRRQSACLGTTLGSGVGATTGSGILTGSGTFTGSGVAYRSGVVGIS